MHMKFIVWIILALLVLFIFLFVVPIRIICAADTRKNLDFSLAVKILLVKIPLYPRKKRLPNLKNFRRKSLEKQYRKKQKDAEKKKAKLRKKKPGSAAKKTQAAKPKRNIKQIIRFIFSLTQILFDRLGRYLRVDIAYFDIIAAAENPADTALLYGWVYALMESFWALISTRKPFQHIKKDSISIYADFEGDKPAVRAKLIFSIALWQLFSIFIHGGKKALDIRGEYHQKETKEEQVQRQKEEAAARSEMIKELRKN